MNVELKYMESKRPKVGVGVALIKDGKVLLGKRKNAHGEGTWSFPGGHLEYKENWDECAYRECLEETGLSIKNIRFGTVSNDVFDEEEKHYVTIIMLADYDAGQLRVMEPEKCEQWKWFIWDKLPEQLFLPIKNILKANYKPLSY